MTPWDGHEVRRSDRHRVPNSGQPTFTILDRAALVVMVVLLPIILIGGLLHTTSGFETSPMPSPTPSVSPSDISLGECVAAGGCDPALLVVPSDGVPPVQCYPPEDPEWEGGLSDFPCVLNGSRAPIVDSNGDPHDDCVIVLLSEEVAFDVCSDGYEQETEPWS